MAKTPEKIIEETIPHYIKRAKLKKAGVVSSVAEREYKLVYDSTTQTLEPVYFWILDFMNGLFKGDVEKLVDNFTSSPGSGHFSELMGKGTRMQEEAMKIYGMVNTVVKSIINLIYDLKEFQLRLKNYEDASSPDKQVASSGLLSLKQIWMDTVDIKRGRGAINMLSQDLNFVTLRDAFMATNSLKQAEDLDLNERVKRILKARVQEFFEWKDRSEKELKKRFEIEKTYLKTQVNTVKTYSRWAKPYLVAAEQLRMKDDTKYMADIVNVFNTLYLELSIFGKGKVNPASEAAENNLPESFMNLKETTKDKKGAYRPVYSCVLVNFKFRGIPQKAGQHYAMGGRIEAEFKAYAMNQEELDLMKYKLEKSDFEDSLKLVEGMTDETLGQLNDDIEELLESKPKQEIKQELAREQDVNPFTALLGLGRKKSKKSKQEPKDKEEAAKKKEEERLKELEEKGVKKDNYVEGMLRNLAIAGAAGKAYVVYDVYKKAHGMASTPTGV